MFACPLTDVKDSDARQKCGGEAEPGFIYARMWRGQAGNHSKQLHCSLAGEVCSSKIKREVPVNVCRSCYLTLQLGLPLSFSLSSFMFDQIKQVVSYLFIYYRLIFLSYNYFLPMLSSYTCNHT